VTSHLLTQVQQNFMMQMIFDNGQRFVKLLQNRSPEASQVLFFEILLQ